MKKVINLLAIWSSVLAASCGQKSLSVPAYVQYYSSADNATVKHVKSGSIEYEFRILPPEYFAIKEMINEPWDEAGFRSRLAEIMHNTYFLVRIKDHSNLTGAGDPGYKTRMIHYYQNLAAGAFSLTTSSDKGLMPSYVHYEDHYGLSPENNLIVCFPRERSREGILTLLYNDGLFQNRNIQVSYSADALNELPTLKMK